MRIESVSLLVLQILARWQKRTSFAYTEVGHTCILATDLSRNLRSSSVFEDTLMKDVILRNQFITH